MHTYIYDSLLTDKNYSAALIKAENKLTDLGLIGRVARLSPLKNIRDIVVEELKKEPKTLIAVGSDAHVSGVLSCVAKSNIPFAAIPIGDNNFLANLLGFTTENAAGVIARRRIINLDVGMINNSAFFKSALIQGDNLRFLIDDKYSVAPENNCVIEIVNFFLDKEVSFENKLSFDSGNLGLLIRKKDVTRRKNKVVFFDESFVIFKNLKIISGEASAWLDNLNELKNINEIKIEPMGLTAVVGSERKF